MNIKKKSRVTLNSTSTYRRGGESKKLPTTPSDVLDNRSTRGSGSKGSVQNLLAAISKPKVPVHTAKQLLDAAEHPAGIIPALLIGIPVGLLSGTMLDLARDLFTGNPPAAGTVRYNYAEGFNAVYDMDATFSLSFYREVHGDLDMAHFWEKGCWEGRVSAPWWNVGFYALTNTDIAGKNPLMHMMDKGMEEGRALSPFFDPKVYFEKNRYILEPIVAGTTGKERNVRLLKHFIKIGLREGLSASKIGCLRSYIRNNTEVEEACGAHGYEKAAAHYYRFGVINGWAADVDPQLASLPNTTTQLMVAGEANHLSRFMDAYRRHKQSQELTERVATSSMQAFSAAFERHKKEQEMQAILQSVMEPVDSRIATNDVARDAWGHLQAASSASDLGDAS